MNLGALLTASLVHTSFEKIYLSSNFLLILGVTVCSERLFSIDKDDWGLESWALYGVSRWPFLSGCFTLKAM